MGPHPSTIGRPPPDGLSSPAARPRPPLLWLLLAALLRQCPAVQFGQCDSPALAPFPASTHCKPRCPSPSQQLWSSVTTQPATLRYSGAQKGRVIFNSTPPCDAEEVPFAFLLEDLPALGHMQMSVTALFCFLLTLPAGAPVTVVWERRPEELAPVKALYYRPLLAHLSAYFRTERQLLVREVDAEDMEGANTCLAGAVVGRRTCALPLLPHGGHCGAWFADPPAVAAFRHFLRQRLNLSLAYDGCCAGNRTHWTALLFDRAKGQPRALRAPEKVQKQVRAALPPAVRLDYYRHPARREEASPFDDNCAQWSRYDLIIAVHGAALSNLICARPCAMVVEVGFETPLTMYAYLAAQMQVHHCFVPVSSGPKSFGKGTVTPGDRPLAECLRQFTELHRLHR